MLFATLLTPLMVLILVFNFNSFFVNQQRALVYARDQFEISLIRKTVHSSVDCKATFQQTPICDGKNLIRLYRASTNNTPQPLTEVFHPDGTGSYGRWLLRSQCDGKGKTLKVRAALIGRDGNFEVDKATNLPWDWEHPSGIISDSEAGYFPLCYSSNLERVRHSHGKMSNGTLLQPLNGFEMSRCEVIFSRGTPFRASSDGANNERDYRHYGLKVDEQLTGWLVRGQNIVTGYDADHTADQDPSPNASGDIGAREFITSDKINWLMICN
jgi:hypothetical protein